MDYQKLILDAFETDLIARRNTGASDFCFDHDKAHHRYKGNPHAAAEAIPGEVLAFCVRSIFGESRPDISSLVWRGFRMSVIKKHSGKKMVDQLAVRLDDESGMAIEPSMSEEEMLQFKPAFAKATVEEADAMLIEIASLISRTKPESAGNNLNDQ